ncbi:hypothetical protein PTSG_10683 [Salpingoeca rosetta]|uniref:DUF7869 domain-containing protein n=1 Tax=Salpingoeca rosetta (strain ATCC 50818 / BSB-021) TaxID=946362 RepID=F2UQ30_SALR5|nr:uncharacterized protein PTSG_10683 [Salpingoeca rosetta]EGD79698.1 hypothetical protein PTSG_10683 [Salpingoeca rosetta]|eukprot:XP_004988648.1 hypothetical protein PTSG_10683 [Salpingoeca rosetta]
MSRRKRSGRSTFSLARRHETTAASTTSRRVATTTDDEAVEDEEEWQHADHEARLVALQQYDVRDIPTTDKEAHAQVQAGLDFEREQYLPDTTNGHGHGGGLSGAVGTEDEDDDAGDDDFDDGFDDDLEETDDDDDDGDDDGGGGVGRARKQEQHQQQEASEPATSQAKQCIRGGAQCQSGLRPSLIKETQRFVQQLSRPLKRVFCQAVLASCVHPPPTSKPGARARVKYQLAGVRLCRGCFLSVLGIGRRFLFEAIADIKEGHIVPSPRKPRPETLRRREQKQQEEPKVPKTREAEAFLAGFIDDWGLENPSGRGPHILLPIHFTKRYVYRQYAEDSDNPIAESSFRLVWLQNHPTARRAKKETDVCDMCATLVNKHATEYLSNHLAEVKQERHFMKHNVQLACDQPGSVAALSFDFAATVRLPHFVRQRKQFYYESGLKADIFGIVFLPTCQQTNYVIPETTAPAKRGSDLVISLLFQYLQSITPRPQTIYLTADNCTGQNKNKNMMRFLSLYSARYGCDVYLHFMIQGHTRTFHDGGFGHIKRAMNLYNVECPRQLRELVDDSASTNHAVDADTVPQRTYSALLGTMAADVTARVPISGNHHFNFRSDTPGVMFYRVSPTDEWQAFQLLDPSKVRDTANSRTWLTSAPPLRRREMTEARVKQLTHIRDEYLSDLPQATQDDFFNVDLMRSKQQAIATHDQRPPTPPVVLQA